MRSACREKQTQKAIKRLKYNDDKSCQHERQIRKFVVYNPPIFLSCCFTFHAWLTVDKNSGATKPCLRLPRESPPTFESVKL